MLRLVTNSPGPAKVFGAVLVGGGMCLVLAIGQSVVEDRKVIGSELAAALLIAAPFLAIVWFGVGLVTFSAVLEFDALQLALRYRMRRTIFWKRGELQIGEGRQLAVRPEYSRAPIFGPVTVYKIVVLHHSVPMAQLPVFLNREQAKLLIDALWSAGCLADDNRLSTDRV